MPNPFVGIGGFFGRFFGNTIGESAAYGIGGALQEPIRPLLQELSNQTWATSTAAGIGRPLDVFGASEVVAEDVEKRAWGVQQSGESGSTEEVFDAVLGATLNAPGVPQLFEAWRRDLITDETFEHGLRKAKLEPLWDAPLRALKQRLLSLSDLANARQQGFVDVARQRSESELQGLDAERADILFELSGLPLGVESMQEALNRGLIDRATFDQAIREGHTKTKYTDLAFALRQPVLSAETYRTLYLKGWITQADMNAGGALHGYTAEQMNLLYLEAGRPAAPGQMWTMLAREVDGPDGTTMDKAQFLKGIRQSDIRPEWGDPLYEIRYTYPPLFQVNRLVQAGAATPALGVDAMRKNRLAPEWVAALEAYWQGGSGADADAHVGRAQTQLWTTLHRSYIAGESTKTAARPVLASLGLTTAAQDQVLALWDAERALVRKQLTPAQIKKAYTKGIKNQATGLTWTRDDALAALIERGYATTEANEFLDL